MGCVMTPKAQTLKETNLLLFKPKKYIFNYCFFVPIGQFYSLRPIIFVIYQCNMLNLT